MDKRTLVKEIAQRTSLTHFEAETACNALFGTKNGWIKGIFADALRDGERVMISGFGVWTSRTRAPLRRNAPGVGETTPPVRRVVRFRASPQLRVDHVGG